MLQNITVNLLIFQGRICIDLQLYYSQTLSQEVFKHMCFKHLTERKYCYGRNSENENEARFFLNGRYSFFMKQKRHMSTLDVFIWLTVKSYSELSRNSHRRSSAKEVPLEISQNSQGNTCARLSFLKLMNHDISDVG